MMMNTYRLSLEVAAERRSPALAWARQQTGERGRVECERETLLLTTAKPWPRWWPELLAFLQPGEHAHVHVVSGPDAGAVHFAHGIGSELSVTVRDGVLARDLANALLPPMTPTGQIITGTWQTDLRDYNGEVVWSQTQTLEQLPVRDIDGQECGHARLCSQVRDTWVIGPKLTDVTDEEVQRDWERRLTPEGNVVDIQMDDLDEASRRALLEAAGKGVQVGLPTGLETVDVSQSGLSANVIERGFGPKFDQIVDYAARLRCQSGQVFPDSSDYEVVPTTDSPLDRFAARLTGAALGLAVAGDDVSGPEPGFGPMRTKLPCHADYAAKEKDHAT